MSITKGKVRGVLLVNLGTPDEPTAAAVRRYLRAFLSDRRVVELPRWLWRPLLELVILPLRSRRVAQNYASIWMAGGSPLRHYSQALADGLARQLGDGYQVELAMTYGNPSLAAALARLGDIDELIVLPLYPQYSCTTTAPVFDALARLLAKRRKLPALRFIGHYHQQPAYVAALADSIRRFRAAHGGADKLLFSFHGIPQRYADAGDPYPLHCQQTAQAVAENLGLEPQQWQLCYQSRFGRSPWLTPYSAASLQQLAGSGVASVQLICPAFAVDCLETLEEIAVENRKLFLQAGGKEYDYIPCLNDHPQHVALLAQLIASP